MSTFVRWLKFNIVGAMGFVLQLASLAVLHSFVRGHYLLLSAAATELTLLHNFAWHLQYTWRDRLHRTSTVAAFTRFQLSNGFVSLAGNLLLVRECVQQLHLPLVTANILAVICCSLINFSVGHFWAFEPTQALKNTGHSLV